jgi:DNA-binding PadR family transcriptional regulator
VAKKIDKRRRKDLDLFVLALVDEGLATTPYRMQVDAGLSLGATIPALRRLQKERLVIASKAGPRGRVEFRSTPTAAQKLRQGWKLLLEAGPTGDLDADLRIAILTLRVGGQRNEAMKFLRAAAESIERSEPFPGSREGATDSSIAAWYSDLRNVAAVELAKGRRAAALAMARKAVRVFPLRGDRPGSLRNKR